MRFIKKFFGIILLLICLFLMMASVFAFFDKESGVGVGILIFIVGLPFLIFGGKLIKSANRETAIKNQNPPDGTTRYFWNAQKQYDIQYIAGIPGMIKSTSCS